MTKANAETVIEAVKIDKKEESENLNYKSEYNGHNVRRLKIDDENAFKCDVCRFKLNSNNEVIIHKSDMHEKVKCSLCSLQLFGKKNLKYHMNDIH